MKACSTLLRDWARKLKGRWFEIRYVGGCKHPWAIDIYNDHTCAAIHVDACASLREATDLVLAKAKKEEWL